VSTRAQKIAKLRNKQYRDAFVGSQISVGLPFQIRALREKRGWKQSQLAGKTGMLQPRISAMESPGGAKFTLETLRRLASAFDVALMVRFVPFSDLLRWSEDFNPDGFTIASFEEDAGLIERKPEASALTVGLERSGQPSLAEKQGDTSLRNVISIDIPKQALAAQPVPCFAMAGASR
jgi:transcriptional regulator with XRE-family HTH domain